MGKSWMNVWCLENLMKTQKMSRPVSLPELCWVLSHFFMDPCILTHAKGISLSHVCTQNFFFFFLGPHLQHKEVPRLRGQIRASAAGLHHSHGNTGCLTYWARSEIELASSWTVYSLLNPWATVGTPRISYYHSHSRFFPVSIFAVDILVRNTFWSHNSLALRHFCHRR